MDADTLRLILLIIGVILILSIYLWERLHEDEDADDARERAAPRPAHRPVEEPDLGDVEDSTLDVAAFAAELEPLLIQLSVAARDQPFGGEQLLDIAEACDLYPGEMEIFHRYELIGKEERIVFSMANMLKPGRFPFDAMADFSTLGVVLFAQLEGDPEDMNTLDELMAAARKLATALDAEVLDEQRQTLTVKKEESLRRAVLANEMRWTRAALQ